MPVDTLRAPAPPTPRELRTPRFPSVRALAERELPTWGVVAVLVIFTLASLWLRTRALHFHYWIDEGLSVGIAGHPLSEIPSVLRQDGSPPLYYAILHVWMSVFGHGEAATHLLSLIFALLCIPVAFWLGASLFGRRAGLISAGLAAGAPYLTIYAQETRMYALLTLLALLVAGSFVEAFIRRRRRYLSRWRLPCTRTTGPCSWGWRRRPHSCWSSGSRTIDARYGATAQSHSAASRSSTPPGFRPSPIRPATPEPPGIFRR
jgi:hypothetical protein